MKTNRILALLSVCGLFAGTATLNMVANYRHESCSTCGKHGCREHNHHNRCGSCPTEHTHSYACDEKPRCQKMVPVHVAPCKQCDTVTTCSYTCPTDYYKAGTCKEGESKSHVGVAEQDADGRMYASGAAATVAADEEVAPAVEEETTKSSKRSRSRKMKNQ